MGIDYITHELLEEYLKAWNPEREMEYGLFRVPIPEFSPSAFREGLVNAFCHRDFTKMISNEENKMGRSLSIHSLLILSILQNERRTDLKRIAQITNIKAYRIKKTCGP